MADATPTKACSKCRFAAPRPNSEHYQCRRNAPSSFTGSKEPGEIMYGWFPVMAASEWCGEYTPAEPQTVDEAAVTLARFVLLGDMIAARALVDKLKEG